MRTIKYAQCSEASGFPADSSFMSKWRPSGSQTCKEMADSKSETGALQTDIDHLANWATLW